MKEKINMKKKKPRYNNSDTAKKMQELLFIFSLYFQLFTQRKSWNWLSAVQ